MAGHGKFFVGGNWKCNGTLESVKKLVTDLNSADIPSESDLEVVIAPTFVHLDYVKNNIKPRYQVAAQNCWVGKGGAFTGEISAEQLHDMGIPWVIIGHSERRSLLEESNDFVGHKAAYALSQDLAVIACIGETLSQRESGNMFDVLGAQLASIADNIADWHNVVVAYEPVWAIGTGKVATPEQAQEVHAFIRKWFNEKVGSEVADELRIIYGGSVNDQNAGEIARKQDVDGFLVGGASLKGKTFAKICQAQTKAYA
jgi:triosephosphate isomerase